MRKIAVIVTVLTFLLPARVAFPAGPFGPPKPFSDERRPTLIGAGYFWNQKVWKPDNTKDFPTNVEFGQNIAFIQAGTLFSEESEGFIRLGAADFRETGDSGAFESDYVFSGALGYKDLWYGDRRSTIGVGPILLGSYTAKYTGDVTLGDGSVAQVEIDQFWDAALAVGIQGKVGSSLILFGGPFGYYAAAKGTVSSPTVGNLTTDFKAKEYVGAYAGFRYTPIRGWSVEGEGQYIGEFSAGVTLAYTF